MIMKRYQLLQQKINKIDKIFISYGNEWRKNKHKKNYLIIYFILTRLPTLYFLFWHLIFLRTLHDF